MEGQFSRKVSILDCSSPNTTASMASWKLQSVTGTCPSSGFSKVFSLFERIDVKTLAEFLILTNLSHLNSTWQRFWNPHNIPYPLTKKWTKRCCFQLHSCSIICMREGMSDHELGELGSSLLGHENSTSAMGKINHSCTSHIPWKPS